MNRILYILAKPDTKHMRIAPSSTSVMKKPSSKLRSYMLRAFFAGALLISLSLVSLGCDDDSSVTRTAPEVDPPASPSGLEASSGVGQATLSWDAAEQEEGFAVSYFVYRDTSPIDELPAMPISEKLPGTTFTDEGLDNGRTYYYRVTAVAGIDSESEASNEAAATPFATPPGRP